MVVDFNNMPDFERPKRMIGVANYFDFECEEFEIKFYIPEPKTESIEQDIEEVEFNNRRRNVKTFKRKLFKK